jgi:hypothetical protein
MPSRDQSVLQITERTVKYSGQVYQLRNITQVGKYRVKQMRRFPAIVSILIGGAGIAIGSQRGGEPVGAGMIGFALILLLWSMIFRKSKFVLMLETSSGSAELFASKNEVFIDQLISTISDVMEQQTEGTNIIAYTDKSKIVNNSIQKIKGDAVAGDKFENIHDSTIVNRSVVQDAIKNVQASAGKDVSKALASIAAAVEESKNAAAGALFNSFTAELKKPAPNKSTLKQFWEGLTTLLPSIATIGEASAKIATLLL